VLHKAVAMQHNIVPRPPTAVEVGSDAQLASLFPFTWSISQFRGRSILERGLRVEHVPQVRGSAACDLS
jgi:hypothetical protein